MLFKFGKFWKSISFIIGSWAFYGFFGFEFATITLLALIVASNFKDHTKFI
tara:strand:+ start:3224 stop:3376 length:153 start_codon:yes stop_codon:yes gene_type:complete